MKEFRIARCLENGKIEEYAIFADGSEKKLIQIHEKYGKYFEVDNEFCNHPLLKITFTDRIKDAIETIRNGNGDCLSTTNFLGFRFDRVLYFIDRKIGEELRQQSIEGWKDTKFRYAIKAGNKNSMSGFHLLNEKDEPIDIFDEDRDPKFFDTNEEAQEYIDELINKAKYFAKRLVYRSSNVKDKEEMDKIINTIYDEIKDYSGSKFSIIIDFMYDMVTMNETKYELKTAECDLDEMGYIIVQIIKNKEEENQ